LFLIKENGRLTLEAVEVFDGRILPTEGFWLLKILYCYFMRDADELKVVRFSRLSLLLAIKTVLLFHSLLSGRLLVIGDFEPLLFVLFAE
jgi:hypothetical protein